MKRLPLLVVLLFIFFLAACASAAQNSTPTATASPAGPLDGKWQGSGQANGKEYQISFITENSIVTDIQYSFHNTPNTSCLNISYAPIEKTDRPQITNNEFSADLGPDLNMSA